MRYPDADQIRLAYEGRNLVSAAAYLGIGRRRFENALAFHRIEKRGPGDATRARYDRQPLLTTDQFQLAIGSLLGDASLCRSNSPRGRPGWVLAFAHGLDQKDYLEHKRLVIGGCKISGRPEGSNLGKQVFQFHYKNRVALQQVADLCLVDGKKTVTEQWVSKLTDLGVAYWFQDDGSIVKTASGYAIRFYTNAFSREEVEVLSGFMRRTYGAHCTISRGNKPSEPVLCMSRVKQVAYFINRIREFQAPSMERKFPCLQ